MHQRRGHAGARVRLYVDLVKAAGGAARLFAMYTPGARHTVAHINLNGREIFVDPIWGCVCRIDGELVGFEDMHNRPEQAALGLELLTLNPGLLVRDDPKQTARVARIDRIYSESQIKETRSFGYLYDDKPHPFHMGFDLARLWYFPLFQAKDPSKIGFIECASQFGIAIPNYFGIVDRRPAHFWEFENADPKSEYEIIYRLKGVRGKVDIEARSDTVEFVSASVFHLEEGDGQDGEPKEWRLCFRPLGENVEIQVIPKLSKIRKGSHYATIVELSLERVSGPLLDREQHTYGVDDIVIRCNGKLPINRDRVLPASDPERVKDYLMHGSFLSIMLRNGEFYPWPQRPFNFTWISDAMAAVYAYRVTGNFFFTDWIVSSFNQILQFRDCKTGTLDDFRKRAMNSWGSYISLHMHGGRKGWVNEVCTAACMTMPILIFCYDIKMNPKLSDRYSEFADRCIPICQSILEEFIDEIQYDEATKGAYFVMPHDGEPEPTAHAAPFAASLVALHAINGENWYLELAEQFAQYYRASISVDKNGVWSWPYRPVPNNMTGPGAFYFKARVSLIFPVVANSLGYLFSDKDMVKFSKTFTTNVLTNEGTIYTTISNDERTVLDDRQLLHYAYKQMANSLRQIVGYYALTLFNPEVGKRIDRFISQNEAFYPHDFMSMPLGVESYAIRLNPTKALRFDSLHRADKVGLLKSKEQI